MTNKSSSRISKIIARIFNVRMWLDWDRVKAYTIYLFSGFKNLFRPDSSTAVESFEEAKARLKISDADMDIKQKSLFRLSLLMVLTAFCIFLYLCYQLFFGSFKAVIVSFVVMQIALILAFRYHFWYYQIKNRKLGCSIQEWFKKGLMGAK